MSSVRCSRKKSGRSKMGFYLFFALYFRLCVFKNYAKVFKSPTTFIKVPNRKHAFKCAERCERSQPAAWVWNIPLSLTLFCLSLLNAEWRTKDPLMQSEQACQLNAFCALKYFIKKKDNFRGKFYIELDFLWSAAAGDFPMHQKQFKLEIWFRRIAFKKKDSAKNSDGVNLVFFCPRCFKKRSKNPIFPPILFRRAKNPSR